MAGGPVRFIGLALTALLTFTTTSFAQQAPVRSGDLTVETVAGGLENPWGLAFLPDGSMLVTERPGRMRIVSLEGVLSQPLSGLPQIAARGQGGLLDVAVDPAFADNRTIWFSYAEPRSGGGAGTALAKAQINRAGTALQGVQVMFRQEPGHSGRNHFGSRIVFDRDGHVFLTLGDRYDLKDEAQNPGNHIGKVVRITREGGVPAGNPKKQGWAPEIWSIGHRNVQAAALHPRTGALWTVEHGALGGDEVNIPKAGLNYGWPIITYGVDYSGAKIGEGREKPGLEQPVHYWDPSIAPSGAAFYTGDAFPAWRGDLLVGALRGSMLMRLRLDGDKVVGEERLLRDLGERIRDVRQGPDGFVYLLTDDSRGRVLRVRPAR
jgi:glucose/arabinose dehydrogenase